MDEEFLPWDAAQYRIATAEQLEQRRDEVAALCADPDCTVGVEELRSEAALIQAEYERRNLAAQVRGNALMNIESGAGRVIDRSANLGGNAEAAPVEPEDMYDTEEYRTAFMEYVCRGREIPAQYRAGDGTTSIGTLTADAPVVIPTTVSHQIIEKLSTYGTIWNKVSKSNVQGGIEFPVGDFAVEAKWIGEDEVSDYQKLSIKDKIVFSYHQLECRVAQSLLASVVTFSEFQAKFTEAVAEAMVRALEQAIIRGDGNGKFQGIVNDTRITNVVTMSAEEFANWKKWRTNIKAKMPISYRNGEFIMAQSTFDSYIETMSDDNNAPVSIGYNPVTGEEQLRLIGKTVTTVEPDILPDFDQANEGDVVAIFGNLSNYLVNTNMQIETVRWVDHETNKVKTKALMIADGKVLDPYGFMLIKKGASA